MKKSLWIAALMASTSSIVHAQTAAGVGAAVSLPEVVVDANTPFNPYAGAYNGPVAETTNITGVKKPIIEVPRAAYVVTPQTLQQQMPQSLAEALQTVPGVAIGNTNGGNSDYITIRGFEVDSQDFVALGNGDGILIDEIKSPTDRAFNANTQTVSLLSGPASLLYGNGNVGGIIDIQRKLPLPEQHAAVSALGGAVGGKFRSIAGTFDITGPIYKSTEGIFAYRLVGSTAGAEPWRKGDTTTRDFLMAPTLAFYSEKLNATVAYEHDRNQQPYDRGVTSTGPLTNPATGAYAVTQPLNISRFTSYSEPWSQYNENLNWVHSKVDYHPDKDTDLIVRSSFASTDLLINETRSDNQTDFFPYGRPAGANPATTPALAPGSILRYQQYTPQGVNAQQYYFSGIGVRRFDLGPVKNELTAGVDYYNFRQEEPNAQYIYYGYNQTFNLFNPNYGAPNLYPNGGRGFIDFQQLGFTAPGSTVRQYYNGAPIEEQKQRDLSYFAQEAATWGPWTLTGGGRYTGIYSYLRNLNSVPNSNSTEHAFLPSGQLLYLINKNASLYASYSQSYQANVYSLGTLPGNTQIVGQNTPQRGEGYEIGVKSKFFDDRVLAQASAFRIDKQHVQSLLTAGVGNFLTFSQAQRSEGAQFSVLGYVTPNVEINVNYSHQNVFVYSDTVASTIGTRVPNAPANTFAAYAYYHVLDGFFNHLTLNAGVFGATANVITAGGTSPYNLHPYAIFSTGFAYSYQKSPQTPLYVLNFKINNLADTTYYPSSGSKTNWITVGEPRSFLLGLSASL